MDSLLLQSTPVALINLLTNYVLGPTRRKYCGRDRKGIRPVKSPAVAILGVSLLWTRRNPK